MSIHRMCEEHWERVRALRLRALDDDPDAFGSTLEREEGFAPAEWKRRLGGPAATFLAESDGNDVGMVTGAPWRATVGEERPGVAGLFGMWVAPEARGSGLGGRLIEVVVVWARSIRFERVVLDVGDENAHAIRLYERHGFLPTGRRGTLPAPRAHVTEHERALELEV